MTTSEVNDYNYKLREKLAHVNICRPTPGAPLTLIVDASALHALLDQLGVPKVDGVYISRPQAAFLSVNSSGTKLSTELFLRPGKQSVALSNVFTRPPNRAQLTALAESAWEAVHTIVNHYQPVDISITIHKTVKM